MRISDWSSDVCSSDLGGPVKAVFPVHLTGQCSDLPAIAALAERHGLALADDAAHAIGSRYRTAAGDFRPIGDGRLAVMTSFSFHPVKTIAMGEGGAVTTDRKSTRLNSSH